MLFLPIRQINLHNRSAVRTPYDKGGIRMKKTFFAFIAIIVIGSCCMYGKTNALTNFSVSDQADSKNKEELIITLLTPQIENAVKHYYGYDRRYEIGDSHAEILKRGDGQNSNIFKIRLKIDTFEGPHNDYYTEFLTFTVSPNEIVLNEYQHSEFVPNAK